MRLPHYTGAYEDPHIILGCKSAVSILLESAIAVFRLVDIILRAWKAASTVALLLFSVM